MPAIRIDDPPQWRAPVRGVVRAERLLRERARAHEEAGREVGWGGVRGARTRQGGNQQSAHVADAFAQAHTRMKLRPLRRMHTSNHVPPPSKSSPGWLSASVNDIADVSECSGKDNDMSVSAS